MINEHTPSRLEPVDKHRRWLRVLSILDACRLVGLTPISTNSLHVLVYLSEILAPVWKLEPLDGKVLKQSSTPYFSSLQQDVDCLIGMGLIYVNDLRIDRTGEEESSLVPFFSLDRKMAEPILAALRELPGEENTLDYFLEVAQAFSRLSDEQIPSSMNEDATYGSSAIDSGQVIDLGEWLNTDETATSHVIDCIYDLAGEPLTPAEAIDVYVAHIAHRAGQS